MTLSAPRYLPTKLPWSIRRQTGHIKIAGPDGYAIARLSLNAKGEANAALILQAVSRAASDIRIRNTVDMIATILQSASDRPLPASAIGGESDAHL